MSIHSTQFEATPGGLTLSNAILLYRSGTKSAPVREGAEAFASFHDVDHLEDGPMIGAGKPLTHHHLRQWTKALGKRSGPEILPANVVVAHANMLAWWVPEQVRTAYFAISNPSADLKALSGRTTVAVPYPAHLFVATRQALGVYALPGNAHPTPDTVLLHSPILNVFLEGHLCWGNIAQPKALTTASMVEYERAVFDSWSTHPNPGQELTVKGKGGLVRLWDDLAASKARHFPVKRLLPFNPGRHTRGAEVKPITLGALVASKVSA